MNVNDLKPNAGEAHPKVNYFLLHQTILKIENSRTLIATLKATGRKKKVK